MASKYPRGDTPRGAAKGMYSRYSSRDRWGNEDVIDYFLDREGFLTNQRPHVHVIIYGDGRKKVLSVLENGTRPFEAELEASASDERLDSTIEDAMAKLPVFSDREIAGIAKLLKGIALPTGETFGDLLVSGGACREGRYIKVRGSTKLCRKKYKVLWDELDRDLRASFNAHAHFRDDFDGKCPVHGDYKSIDAEASAILNAMFEDDPSVEEADVVDAINRHFRDRYFSIQFEKFEVFKSENGISVHWKIEINDDY